MNSVDNRVVKMTFDNKQFESGVHTSMLSLRNLKESLNLDAAARSLVNLEKVGRTFTLSGISQGVDIVASRFTALGIVATTALQNITNAAVNTGRQIVSSVINPIIQGGKNRALNIEQAKFQLEGLGVAWDQIKDDINYGVKDTAYGLDAAAKVASQLVASDVQIGDSMKKALRGVSGVAAMTSSSYEDIGNIFTTVAGNGKLMTEQLRQFSARGLNAAATLAKYLNVTEAEVREMITQGKLDFATFAEAMDNAFGEHAKDANKTFTGALSNMKAALSRIGADFATPAFDDIRDVLNALIPVIDGVHASLKPLVDTVSKGMGDVAKFSIAKLTAFDEKKLKSLDKLIGSLVKSFTNIGKFLLSAVKQIKGAFTDIFPPMTVEKFSDITKKLEDTTSKFKISDDAAKKLKSTFKGVFTVLNFGKGIFTALLRVIAPLSTQLGAFGKNLFSVTSKWGDNISQTDKAVQKNDSFYNVIKTLTSYIKSDFLGLLPAIENFYGSLCDLISPITQAVSKAKQSIKDFLVNGFSGLDTDKIEQFNVIQDIITYLAEAVLNIGTAVLKIAKPLTEAFAEMFPKVTAKQIRDIAGSITEFTQGLIISDETADKLKRTFKGVFAIFDIFRQAVSAVIRTVFPNLSSLGDLGGGILDITANLGDFIVKIDETIRENDLFYNSLQNFIEFVKTGYGKAKEVVDEFFNLFKDKKTNDAEKQTTPLGIICSAIKTFAEEIGKVSPNLGNLLSKFSDSINGTFGEINFGRLYKLMNFGFLSAILVSLSKLRGVLSTLFSFGRVFHNLNGIFVNVRSTLTEYSNNLKANKLKTIAISISILAASLIALSMVKEENLTNAMGAMTSLFAELMIATAMLESFSKEAKPGMFKMAASLILISVAVSILAGVLKKLSKIDPVNLLTGVLAMTTALAAVTAAMYFMPKDLSLVGKGLLLVSVSILVMSHALKKLSEIDPVKLLSGVLAMAAGLAAVTAAMYFMPKHGLVAVGAGLILVSVALIGMAAAIKLIASSGIEGVVTGVLGMAAALAALVVALNFMPLTLPVIGAGLLVVSAALLVLSGALKVMGSMNIAEIGKSLLALVGSLAIIAIAATLMTSALPGAAAMLVMAGALAVLAPALFLLGKMNIAEIGKGLLVLAGTFAVIGISALLISPILPLLLGLSAAVALLGVSALAAGVGVAALAVGLTVLISCASAIAALGDMLLYSAAAVADAITVLIMSLLSSLETIIPKAFDIGAKILLYLLVGIAEHLDSIIGIAVTIIVKLINGLAMMIEPLVQAGMNLIIKFIDGMADAIRNNTDKLFAAVRNLMSSLVEFALSALQQLVRNIPIIGNELSGYLDEAKTAVRETLAPESMEKIGRDAAEAMVNGISSEKENAKTAGSDMGESAKSGLSSALENFGSFGTLCGTDFSSSLGNTTNLASMSGTDLGTSAVDGLGLTLSDFSSLGSSFGDEFSSSLGGTADMASAAGNDIGLSTLSGFDIDLTNLGENTGTQFVTGLSGTQTDAKDSAASISTSVLGNLSNSKVDAQYQNAGSGNGIRFVKGLKSEKNDARNTGTLIANSGAVGANSAVNEFRNAGINSGRGFISGIRSTDSEVSAAASSLAQAALNSMRAALDINSPSKETEKLGMYTDKGFAKGLEKYSRVVDESAGCIGDMLLSSIQNAMSMVADAVNGDIEISPTIRPVLDMSQLTSEARGISSVLGKRTFELTTMNSGLTRSSFDMMSGFMSEMKNRSNIGVRDTVNAISEIRGDIAALGDAITKMQIKMDTGALVGSIAAPMDMALGQRMSRKGRSN